MYRFAAYGLGIHSSLPLPELVPADLDADVRIFCTTAPDLTAQPGRVHCISAATDAVLLGWGSVATALIRNGSELHVSRAPEIPDQVIRLLILGPALGVLLHQRGQIVLHASVMEVGGVAVALLGTKGAGKSTTAAALCARGHRLVADDLLVLDSGDPGVVRVQPGSPQLRLWPDAAQAIGRDPALLPRLRADSHKRALPVPDSFRHETCPLGRIYLLKVGDTLALEPVEGQVRFIELVSHSYALRFVGSHGIGRGHFQGCRQIAEHIPMYYLRRPTDLGRVCELAELIEMDVNATVSLE